MRRARGLARLAMPSNLENSDDYIDDTKEPDFDAFLIMRFSPQTVLCVDGKQRLTSRQKLFDGHVRHIACHIVLLILAPSSLSVLP